MKVREVLPVQGVLNVFDTHMSSREPAKMGDILATEADLLGMIKEVTCFQTGIFKSNYRIIDLKRKMCMLSICFDSKNSFLLLWLRGSKSKLFSVFCSTLNMRNSKKLFRFLTRSAKRKASLCQSQEEVLSETPRFKSFR